MLTNLESNQTDIFCGCNNASLQVVILYNRSDLQEVSYGNSWDKNKGDRSVDVCINEEDLEAISLNIFLISTGKLYKGKDNILVGRNRNRESFQQSFPEYPMLGRINYVYGGDVFFNPEEVKKLREECLRIKLILNSATDLALRKLIYSCDKAIEVGLSLGFLCN
jgi:hypothetical protein